MKHKLTFALVVLMTSTAFADFQAPVPEFKNEKQLAEWQAEKASEATKQGYVAEEAAFYTGKPYLASSGTYAFKFRSYDSELARWTSEDPSGFPDGANGNIYAPNPTREFDFSGLWKWRFTGSNGSQIVPGSFTAPIDIDGTTISGYDLSGYGSNGKATSLTLAVTSTTSIDGWFDSATAPASGGVIFSINETSGEVIMTGLHQNSGVDQGFTIGEVTSGYNVGYKDGTNVTQVQIAFNHGYKSNGGAEVGFEGSGLSVKVTIGNVDWSLPQGISFALNKEKYE
jgi:RHS repeat-associated protein